MEFNAETDYKVRDEDPILTRTQGLELAKYAYLAACKDRTPNALDFEKSPETVYAPFEKTDNRKLTIAYRYFFAGDTVVIDAVTGKCLIVSFPSQKGK